MNSLSSGSVGQFRGNESNGELRLYRAADCFSSIIFSRLVFVKSPRLREVMVSVGAFAWNIGCCRDAVQRQAQLTEACNKGGAAHRTDGGSFAGALRELVALKVTLFPWIDTKVDAVTCCGDEEEMVLRVWSGSRSEKVSILVSPPVQNAVEFANSMETIAQCTAAQLPLLSNALIAPGFLSDIDRTKMASIYSVQSANMLGYARILQEWARMAPSPQQLEAIQRASRLVTESERNTHQLLRVLLDRLV